MTLDQLRIFIAVAERQHMTQAARALHLTQSAVSGAIHTLEQRHGVELFHRVGRRIELTGDGAIFLDDARTILRSVANAEMTLLDLAGMRRGVLTIYSSLTVGSYWLPPKLVQFQRIYPNIDVKVTIGNTAEVAAAIHAGNAEVGLIEGAIEDASLETHLVAKDKLVVVVGADHPWSRLKRVNPAQLLAANWILREKGSGTRSVFEAALEKLGVSPREIKVVLEIPSNEAICTAIAAGHGVTAVSLAVADSLIRAGQLHLVSFPPLERPFMTLKHKNRELSRAARAFIESLESGQKRIARVVRART